MQPSTFDPELVLKVSEQFKNWRILPPEKITDEVVFVGEGGAKIGINKHLLMIRNPTFAEMLLSEDNCEVNTPLHPSFALKAIQHYVAHENLNLEQELTLKELIELYPISASSFKMGDFHTVILRKIESLICQENPLQYAETLCEFLASHKNLALKYIQYVLKYEHIPFLITNTGEIALRLCHIDLLNRRDPLAKILKPHVKVLILQDENDLKHRAELFSLPEKTKKGMFWLSIKHPISLAHFHEIANHFPNITHLHIAVNQENHTSLLDAIAEIKSIKSLLLIVPKPKEPEKSDGVFDNFINTIWNKPQQINLPELTIPEKLWVNFERKSIMVSDKCTVQTPYDDLKNLNVEPNIDIRHPPFGCFKKLNSNSERDGWW